jgi:N-acetylmuramoyl-L-alanine amidase
MQQRSTTIVVAALLFCLITIATVHGMVHVMQHLFTEPVIREPAVAVLPRSITEQELKCLSENVYHESRNQSITGQYAVAFVTLNRWLSNRYPNNICHIVQQKQRGVCQFSWFCQKSKHIKETEAWDRAKAVASYVVKYYNTGIIDPTQGALFYHADYVEPRWRNGLQRTVRIDQHIFYRNQNGYS